MRTPARRQRGFTLFELLIVIMLVAVATSILALGIGRGMHAASERSALASMVSTLRSARVQAIATGRPVVASFDLTRRTVQAPGRKGATWPTDFKVQLHTARDLGAGFAFYPDGTSSGGHVLLVRGDAHWRIDIAWLTGSVALRTLP